MRSTEFKVTGFIDDILDPEDILIDGQELTIRAFRIHTRDGLVFESQSDADSVLDILGWGDLDSLYSCLLYTSPSPRDRQKSRMPSSA